MYPKRQVLLVSCFGSVMIASVDALLQNQAYQFCTCGLVIIGSRHAMQLCLECSLGCFGGRASETLKLLKDFVPGTSPERTALCHYAESSA